MKRFISVSIIVFAVMTMILNVSAEFDSEKFWAGLEKEGFSRPQPTEYTGCTLPPPNPTSAIKAHNTSEPTAQPETAQPTQEGVIVKLTVTPMSISAAALTFSLVSMAFSVMSYRNSKRREKDFL